MTRSNPGPSPAHRPSRKFWREVDPDLEILRERGRQVQAPAPSTTRFSQADWHKLDADASPPTFEIGRWFEALSPGTLTQPTDVRLGGLAVLAYEPDLARPGQWSGQRTAFVYRRIGGLPSLGGLGVMRSVLLPLQFEPGQKLLGTPGFIAEVDRSLDPWAITAQHSWGPASVPTPEDRELFKAYLHAAATSQPLAGGQS